MQILRFLGILGLAHVYLLGVLGEAQAQPVRNRVLARLETFEEAGCSIVKVNLNFPVRYVRHFPLNFGDEVRIKVLPISVNPSDKSDVEALVGRESVRAPKIEQGLIDRVLYEGEATGGPLLTLYLGRDAAFKVGQGADFRSIIIAISGDEPAEKCLPNVPSPAG